MVTFICKRMLMIVPIIIIISLIVFFALRLIPGDPAEVYLRLSKIPPTDEAIAQARADLGLTKPLYVQYFEWLWKGMHLDFGQSFSTKNAVLSEVFYYFPMTLNLTCMSVAFIILASVPLGILSACYSNKWIDHLSRVFAIIGNSMPAFWLGFLLLYMFSLQLGWLPSGGRGTFSHYVLPTLTLSIPYIAIYTRLLRTSLVESMQQPFVLYSRARGLSEKRIMWKHILKHAMLPVVTSFGVSIGYLLGGTIIVESVFSWPGIGRYFVTAILNRDYPVIQFYVLFMAIIFSISNLIVDIISNYLDPRIRFQDKRRAD
ncbi:ABC transporter permease subunit [Priestia megaterium]|nr:ABC transporter permease subunit [Priestia megaterium]